MRVASQSYVTANVEGEDEGTGLVDLSDIHAHLSNHCIAETHPDYGKYEPTNELWYDEFEEILLEMTDGRVSFGRDLIPQIHAIIRHTLLAVKERLQGSDDRGGYRSFNVFGYDFMLSKEGTGSTTGVSASSKPTSSMVLEEVAGQKTAAPQEGAQEVKVWLLEVNSSPAVANDLLVDFVQDLLAVVVDPFFPPEEREEGNEAGGSVEREVLKEHNLEEEEKARSTATTCLPLSGAKSTGVAASDMFPRGFDCIYHA